MNNFKFYVQELKKIFNYADDYNIDSLLAEEDKTVNYLIPVKASTVNVEIM